MTGLAVVAAAVAAWLIVPRPPPAPVPPAPVPVRASSEFPRRLLVSAAAGVGVAVVLPGALAPLLGLAGAVAAWIVVGRAESPQTRRSRAEVRRDLPHVVNLLAAALGSGAAPGEALEVVTTALPGAAVDRLAPVRNRLALGVDPGRAWGTLVGDPELAPLARTWVRAHETGAPVVASMLRLADDLTRSSRAEVESRARSVGVKAAVPLGVCLLPAFLLIGIVPVVAGMVGALRF